MRANNGSVKFVRPILAVAIPIAAIAAAINLGWIAAHAVFGKFIFLSGLTFFLPLLFPASLLYGGFRLYGRLRGRRTMSWRPLALGCGATLFVATISLHFVRKTPTRFGFLGDHEIAFVSDLGLYDGMETTYTFRADWERLIQAAESELLATGYEVKEASGNVHGTKEAGPRKELEVSLYIYPGKALGTSWFLDADKVNADKVNIDHTQDEWVTVTVWESDILPGLVRDLLP